jgi:hypothetical protein
MLRRSTRWRLPTAWHDRSTGPGTISSEIEGHENDPDPGIALRISLLRHAEMRTLTLVRALTAFYVSIGSFAAASLVSLLGAVFFTAHQELVRQITLAASLCAGVIGVGGLTYGSGLLVLETRTTLRGLAEETRFMLAQHKRKQADELQ